jgi:iron complex outermembrane receptor protein
MRPFYGWWTLSVPIQLSFALILLSLSALSTVGQSTSTLRGKATLGDNGNPVHNVLVTILQLKRTVDTDEQGNYEFQNLPPGKYDVVAHLDRVPDIVQTVVLTAGSTTPLDPSKLYPAQFNLLMLSAPST